jgi:hypothetical protein
MSESSSNNIVQESNEPESKEPEKLILRIRSPSEIAYLNGLSHASSIGSSLNQVVDKETYLTPSMLPQDEHSDLEATSPKLKFGEIKIHEYISNQSLSPNKNVNISDKTKEKINSSPKIK